MWQNSPRPVRAHRHKTNRKYLGWAGGVAVVKGGVGGGEGGAANHFDSMNIVDPVILVIWANIENLVTCYFAESGESCKAV